MHPSNNLFCKAPLYLSILLCLNFIAKGQNISEKMVKFPTYYFHDPNPLPSFIYNPKIYPYHQFQGYDFDKTDKNLKMITLENEWIEIQVFPEVGGKVWGATDKLNGNEFIYKNEVAKFRNIAMRGPWTSGGIEFNFGIIGHHPGAATPVDYKLEKLINGSVICTVGGIDLPSRTQWRVKIILPKNQSAFTTKAVWYNPTETEQSYYNWMTAAAAAKKDLVFYAPGNQYLTHAGISKSWPLDSLKRNLSKYEENNFGFSKSYHIIGEYNDFFGGYYEESETGFGHWGRYDEIPGKKLWIWNLSRAGGIWEDLLTDTDGQYVEYQSGRLFVQYFPGKENPISQATFDPHLTDQWTEVWFPVKGIRGIKEASPFGAMNVIELEDSIEVYVNSFKAASTQVVLTKSGKSLSQSLEAQPSGSYVLSFPKHIGNYSVAIPGLELYYKKQPELIKRSFNNPENILKKNTLEKTFLKAKDAQRFREFSLAVELLTSIIKEDPTHLSARMELSSLYYRNGMYEKALPVANKGLQFDAYHNGLNYTIGLVYMAKRDWINAKEHLGWAARSFTYRSSANALLAQICIIQKKYNDAKHYNDIALKFNTDNINALSQKAMLYRIMGDNTSAFNAIKEIEAIDPINHFSAYEKVLLNVTDQENFINSHQSEFPHQTFIELALFYFNRNFYNKAIQILEMGPNHLLNSLWLAYLKQDPKAITSLDEKSIAFVFPFRNESLEMLDWIVKNSSSWKAKYLKGINLLGRNQTEKGLQIFKALGSKPSDPLFYYIRGMLFKKHQISGYKKDLNYAYSQSPNNWRFAFSLAEDHFESGMALACMKIIRKVYQQDKDNYFAGMLLAQSLNNLKQFNKTIDLLKDIRILPYEHASEGRKIYSKAYVGSALQYIEKNQNNQAQSMLETALLWPEHIGVGKPFDPEERWERFLLAYIHQSNGNSEAAKLELTSIIKYSKEQIFQSSKYHLLGIYALYQIHGKKEVEVFIEQLLESKHGTSAITERVVQYFYQNDQLEWNKKFIFGVIDFLKP